MEYLVDMIHCAFDRMADPKTLVENPRNPNRHSTEQIRLLAKIIDNTGWRAPITVSKRSGFITRGHGRLRAALLLDCEAVPVDDQDYADEATEWADMIADNRIAELADIDRSALKDILEELDTGAIDMELAGWDEDSMAALMSEFHVDEVDAPFMNDGDRSPYQQMTFTLHDEQVEEVMAAITKAKSDGGAESASNENSNGNALAWICERYTRG